MNFEHPELPRKVVPLRRATVVRSLPHLDVGFTAAIRRAYNGPLETRNDQFDGLLAKLN